MVLSCPTGRAKKLLTQKFAPLPKVLPRGNLVKHGNNLQVWDLHFEVISLEKVGFLYNQGAPKYRFSGKGRRRPILNAERERGDAPRLTI